MAKEYFPNIDQIPYLGKESDNPLSYRYYDRSRVIMGKTMEQHLRIAVCFWHTFCWQGEDNFGAATFNRDWLANSDPMTRASARVEAAFEFFHKLGVPFYTFHDRDISPEGATLAESHSNLQIIGEQLSQQMDKTKIELLWGTANLFSHPRYMAGAATNPNPEVFAYACAQVKSALDLTHQLGGKNYVLWGGREGYDTLLNTDMAKETEQLARFLSLLVDYKHKIGFEGLLLIEPKPCEPTKHQYDYDTATVFAFLQKYGLEEHFKVNIEGNHATLAGHRFAHEVAYAINNNVFGSIDANRGDPQLGWDTDQFPSNLHELSLVIYLILQHGGFTTGGFNFDTKLRRQSIGLEDMFYGHIAGIDALARALLIAADILEKNLVPAFTQQRYQAWQDDLGQAIFADQASLEQIAGLALECSLDPQPISGRQELLEKEMSDSIY